MSSYNKFLKKLDTVVEPFELEYKNKLNSQQCYYEKTITENTQQYKTRISILEKESKNTLNTDKHYYEKIISKNKDKIDLLENESKNKLNSQQCYYEKTITENTQQYKTRINILEKESKNTLNNDKRYYEKIISKNEDDIKHLKEKVALSDISVIFTLFLVFCIVISTIWIHDGHLDIGLFVIALVIVAIIYGVFVGINSWLLYLQK